MLPSVIVEWMAVPIVGMVELCDAHKTPVTEITLFIAPNNLTPTWKGYLHNTGEKAGYLIQPNHRLEGCVVIKPTAGTIKANANIPIIITLLGIPYDSNGPFLIEIRTSNAAGVRRISHANVIVGSF